VAFEVLPEPGAVVLAPHALASSRTPSAAIVYLVFRDAAVFNNTVFNSKVSPGRLRAHRNSAVVVIFTAYCHADDDEHVSSSHRIHPVTACDHRPIVDRSPQRAESVLELPTQHRALKIAQHLAVRG